MLLTNKFPRAARTFAVGTYCLGILLSHAAAASAQAVALVPNITRAAGTGTPGYSGDSGNAISVELNSPSYAVVDATGNMFLSDTGNNCVRRINASGVITTLAGLAQASGQDTCDGTSNPAPTDSEGLLHPTGLAIDSTGNLFIADAGHHCVRRLPAGQAGVANLRTVVGVCTADASLPSPVGLAVDQAGTIYVSTQGGSGAPNVFQVVKHLATDDPTTVCRVAGPASPLVPTACPGNDGSVTPNAPSGLTLDAAGELLIADTKNGCVRKVTNSGSFETLLGQCQSDGTGSPLPWLVSPAGLAIGPAGYLYTTDSMNGIVIRSSITGAAPVLVAGIPTQAGTPYSSNQDGSAATAVPLATPLGIGIGSGHLFIVEAGNHVVRQLTENTHFPDTAVGAQSQFQNLTFSINAQVTLSVTTSGDYSISANSCAGTLSPSGLASPTICTVTASFNPTLPGLRTSALLVSDAQSGTNYTVPLQGIGKSSEVIFSPGLIDAPVTNLASPSAITTSPDGDVYFADVASGSAIVYVMRAGGAPVALVTAGLQSPTALALSASGDLYIADKGLGQIVKYDNAGTLRVVATGLSDPEAIAIDPDNNLYVADGSSGAVTKIQRGGEQIVVTGLGTTLSASNIPAIQAKLLRPSGLAFDPSGILYVSDAHAFRVYAVQLSTGLIFSVAGNGTQATTSPGFADGTGIAEPRGLALNTAGDLYIADGIGNRVWVVYGGGLQGSGIASLAGTGVAGASGDNGFADVALLNDPVGVAVSAFGTVHVIDLGNFSIRRISYPDPSIDFGDVALVKVSSPLQVKLWNIGNQDLNQTESVKVSPPEFSSDAASTSCGQVVPAGSNCNLGFTFTPLFLGPLAGDATVHDDSALPTPLITLKGNGVAPKNVNPGIKISSVHSTFGSVYSLHAAVIGNGLTTPTGSVIFLANGTILGTASVQTDGTADLSPSPLLLNVGAYPITAFYSGDDTYNSASETATLTITRAQITVNVNSVSRPYSLANPDLTGVVLGVPPGQTFIVDYSTTATQSSLPGTYPITATVSAGPDTLLSNYQITVNPGVLTITKNSLTVQVANATQVYGAALPTFTSTITGALPGDTFNVAYSTSATPTSPVGSYAITATVSGANLANYATVTVVPATLTITAAPLSVVVANAARFVGQPDPIFTGVVSGIQNNDALVVAYSTTATTLSPAGTYPITATVGGVAAANYTVTVTPGVLTITAKNTLTVLVTNATEVYGGALPTFTSTIVGALPGDTFNVQYSTAATSASPAGNYPITAVVTGANLGNYAGVTVVPGTLTITPAPLSVVVANATRAVGDPDPVFTGTVTGIQNNDSLIATYATSAGRQSPAGTYPITATLSGAAVANYAVTMTPGTLTITAAVTKNILTVQVANAMQVYGGVPSTFTSTIAGALPGDTFTVVYSTPATAATPVGTYPITATVTGANISSYATVTIIPGNLTINPAPLNVVVADASRSVGQTDPVFTGTVTGVQNNDPLVVSYSTTATQQSPAGKYPISATVDGAPIANYIVTMTPGTLTITPAVIGTFTISAAPSNQPVTAGLSTAFMATLTSQAGFAGSVTLACSGLPAGAVCKFSPSSVSLTPNGQGTANVSVTTVAANARLGTFQSANDSSPLVLAMSLPIQLPGIFALFGAPGRRRRRRNWVRRCVLGLTLVAAMGSIAGCGCGIQTYKTYTVTITATGTSLADGSAITQSTSVQLGVVQAP